MVKQFLCCILFLAGTSLHAQSPAQLADSLKSGFRGLSVVNENVIWLSGRKGLVGISTNGGTEFTWTQVKGFEKLDFRSLHAFNEKSAVIASAGSPAVILRTDDGAKTWNTIYRSDDSVMFFDGIAFWDNQRGIIFGDPVNGRMFLMETMDGGKSWTEIPFENRPQLEKGEASFAASGTSIRVLQGGHIWTATGGTKARLFHSRDYGHRWETIETPMIQGQPSQGIFSVVFADTLNGVIVGGDYANDTLRKDNCFYTNDGGKTWKAPSLTTGGYRSCVSIYAPIPTTIIATGTSGVEISQDGGRTWEKLDAAGNFNTVVFYHQYGKVYFGGSKKQYFGTLSFK
jgi:photosystem II stability/assembly factor-like uncharacterized protein